MKSATGEGVVSITPSDSTNIAVKDQRFPRSLYVGGAGNVSIVCPDDSTAVFSNVAAGTFIPVDVKRVNNTNTTATLLIGIY